MAHTTHALGSWRARLWPPPRGTTVVILLAVLLGAALLGAFGGTPAPWRVARAPEGTLAMKTPLTLRGGLFFEQRVRVAAQVPIADLVIAIEPSLLRDITVNTMIPAADKEGFDKGSFRLHYGPLDPGDSFEFKLDGQVNPTLTGSTAGRVAWYDGERLIAALPLHITVLP